MFINDIINALDEYIEIEKEKERRERDRERERERERRLLNTYLRFRINLR